VLVERPGEVAYADLPAPEPGPWDVAVSSRVAGVCRTDLEIVQGLLGDAWVRYPVVPGHEWSGVVTAVGERVTDVAPGDRVVCEGIVPCGRCARCRVGDTNLCRNYDQIGFTRAGGYAEAVLAPRHVVHRLPDSVSFESAVLIEPAACVLRGLERAAPRPGERIGVVGIGTLGSLALLLARLYSPALLVAYGVRESELELARRLGADQVVHVGEEDAAKAAGDGLDLVVESAGVPEAVELAASLLRQGGRCALLGISGGDRPFTLPQDRFSLGDISLIGSFSYTSAVWSRVVGLVSAGAVDFAPLVTHRFPAAEFERAFALLESRESDATKVLLEHA
jgi:2-desacetyl-2-hydroxyethyl bacteriochlorophyllide A dehydrogenase